MACLSNGLSLAMQPNFCLLILAFNLNIEFFVAELSNLLDPSQSQDVVKVIKSLVD